METQVYNHNYFCELVSQLIPPTSEWYDVHCYNVKVNECAGKSFVVPVAANPGKGKFDMSLFGPLIGIAVAVVIALVVITIIKKRRIVS